METPKSISWIKASDFVETIFCIKVRNTTTNSKTAEIKNIKVEEIGENGLMLRLPTTVCALGHHLILDLLKKKVGLQSLGGGALPPQEETLFVTGKVIEIENCDKSANYVNIQFYQFDELKWKGFVNECINRQKEVNRIVKVIIE